MSAVPEDRPLAIAPGFRHDEVLPKCTRPEPNETSCESSLA